MCIFMGLSSRVAAVLGVILMAKATEAAENNKEPCANGNCPSPFSEDDNANDEDGKCGVWLGPSPIKQEEQHGFGFGMFTGKPIKQGETLESVYTGSSDPSIGELVIPIFGSKALDTGEHHPPIREYIWGEESMTEIAVEFPDTLTWMFLPGAGAIIPCTDKNYNLDLMGDGKMDGDDSNGRDSVKVDTSVHRSRDATAGSFSTRHSAQYVAVRDIAAGEELTCKCSDDDYDGGAYYLSHYHTTDDASICVDRNVRVGPSSINDVNVGLGLFAKRSLAKDSVIISSPLIPLHRDELEIEDYDKDPVNSKQLLLNYCYGHPSSDLLWLPYGPLVNYINHGSEGKANAKLRWHPMTAEDTSKLDRRHQHHHPELLKRPAQEVAETHGKAMTVDIVATREIEEGEEILIDYGPEWEEAWQTQRKDWKEAAENWESETDTQRKLDPNYVSAEAFLEKHGWDAPFRTEEEQVTNPYPENLDTFCFYSENQDQDSEWYEEEDHDCFRPCTIERRVPRDGDDLYAYQVQFNEEDDPRILQNCLIDDNYLLDEVPHSAVRLVDKPYTTDVFLRTSFRHEIGVPPEMYPQMWMRKKLRTNASSSSDGDLGHEFKRKTVSDQMKGKAKTTEQEVKVT